MKRAFWKTKCFAFLMATFAAFLPYLVLSSFGSGDVWEKIKMAAQCTLGPFLLVYMDPSELKQIFHFQNYLCWIVGFFCVVLPGLLIGLSFFRIRNLVWVYVLFFVSACLWLSPTLVVMGAPA